MPRVNEVLCWSCGQKGVPVPGNAWTRECKTCDVTWNAKPPARLITGK